MPSPRAMYGGYGALKIVVRVEPPGSEAVARSKVAAERGVRARYSAISDDGTTGSSLAERRLSRVWREVHGQPAELPCARTRIEPSARRIVAPQAPASPCSATVTRSPRAAEARYSRRYEARNPSPAARQPAASSASSSQSR